MRESTVQLLSFDHLKGGGLRSGPAESRKNKLITGAICVAMVLGLTLVIAGGVESYWEIVTCVVVVVLFGVTGLQTFLLAPDFRPGAVRLAQGPGSTRFVPNSRAAIVDSTNIAIAIAWAAAGLVLAVLEYQKQPEAFSLYSLPRSVFLAWVLGAFAIAYASRGLKQRLKAPTGLMLTEQEILGAGRGKIQRVAWSQVLCAEKIDNKATGMSIRITDRSQNQPLQIHALLFGSDPLVVVVLIHFYRDHPEERYLLADPERAMQRFQESLM